MHEPLAMRLVERVGDLPSERQHLGRRQRTPFQPVGQRLALHVLHDQVVEAVLVADVVEHADVRMVEARDRTRLALEPRPRLLDHSQRIEQVRENRTSQEEGLAPAVEFDERGQAPLPDLFYSS